jgi:hypothetical protein
MIMWLLIVIAVVLNIWYLASFRLLMGKLKTGATEYWEKIGRPDSLSANHVMSLLSNLYKKEMSQVCSGANSAGLLRNVRWLLPTAFVVTGAMLLALAHVLNSQAVG